MLATSPSYAQSQYSLSNLEQRLNPQANTAKALDAEEKIHRIKLDRLDKEIAWLSANDSANQLQSVSSTTAQRNLSDNPIHVNLAEKKPRQRSLASLRRLYVSFWIAQQRQSAAKQLLSVEADLRRYVRQKQDNPQQQLMRKLFSALEMARRGINSDYEISQLALQGLKELTTGHISSFEAIPPKLSAVCFSEQAASPVSAVAWTMPTSDEDKKHQLLQHDYQTAQQNRSDAQSKLVLAEQTFSSNEDGLKLKQFSQQLDRYRAAINLLESENILLSSHIALLAYGMDNCSDRDSLLATSTTYQNVILSKLRNGKWASKLDLEPLSTPKRKYPTNQKAIIAQAKTTPIKQRMTRSANLSTSSVNTEPVQVLTPIVVTHDKRTVKDQPTVRVRYDLLYPKASRMRVRYE